MRLDVGIARDSAALTLMSVDVERISSGLQYVHEVWASPIDIGLALWLLERQLGLAVVAFASIFILCTLLGLGVATTMGERQQRWLQAIQNRVQSTSEMLKNMKEIRLGGLQELMAEKLRVLRAKEVSQSTPFKRALTLIVTFCESHHTDRVDSTPRRLLIGWVAYTTTSSGPLLAFTMYSLLAKRNGSTMLNYDKAYTALSLFALLQSPMALILDAIAGLASALGAVDRVGDYLSKPTATSGDGSRLCSPLALPCAFKDEKAEPEMVKAQGYSAGWDPERPMVLKDLNFEIRPSSINFVVGPVACGKTTLLLAILGEVSYYNGRLEVVVPRVGYCSQTPWITNATIRHNILGTSVYNQPWYDKVVGMCLLQDDIDGFPRGDQEWVGNSGMTLSGGQKSRLAIARAVYAREKLLLLDDVFSGLDGKTEEHLLDNLFGPGGLLRETETTVIIATHAVQRLAYADQIIILDSEGHIADEGASSKVIAIAKEMVYSASKKDQSAGPSLDSGPDISRMQSVEEGPTGQARRTGDTAVYKYYIQTVHPFSASIFFAACTLFVLGLTLPQFMVKWWLERGDQYTVTHMGTYLGTCGGLSAMAILSLPVAVWHLTERMLPRASIQLHASLLTTVLQAPLQFFSTTDVGTTLNRFAQDLQLSDMELPLALFNTTVELLLCVANLIIIAITSKWIGIALPALLAVFYTIQKFYLRTARQLRLLDIEAKAPLFSTFLELISGLTTIRAFGWQADFGHRNREVFDRSQKPFYLLYCVQRWLNLVLDLVVAAVAIMVVTIGVCTKGQVDAGFMGIALVNIVQLSISIKAFLSNWTNLEISIGAVSRIRAFTLDVPLPSTDGTESTLPIGWPEKGRIQFQNVTAQYEGSPHPVIRNLTLSIAPGEKIALCGATGSGKSSLATSLFRLLIPSKGTITIDDVDISTVTRETLYRRLICVTQSPHLIAGSIRENVDPLGATSDDKAIELALKEVHLWDTVASRGGIHAQLSEGIFSVGQQQLLCLARAMIRPGSVVVLDEVTASVDQETDQAMQKIIRRHFASRTVLTIAHRISTILDSDRVAVVSDGAIVELGPPGELLARNPPSRFRGLYDATTVSNQSSETLREV
ncbi:ABC transporter, putative [Penicillium digitatum PHI26]|uniref:ABC transporter, putative n=2 Tax=Penicillium digitatum TaxID=36651 RepID=K9G784_PEND2|nr:ABC transporter, putative [Penicillium digitatum Pd1]EKV04366.1 ABC transporter, putative [Penicillium digitatum Pd1]EKV17244.1 ABC transporter, putative [Penicillium digitatum PHI26]